MEGAACRNGTFAVVPFAASEHPCDHRCMVTADRTARTAREGAPDVPAGDGGEVDALTLGRRIRDRRTAVGMTLGGLAQAIDRAPSQVSAIENGKREPRLSMLR